MRGDPFIGPVFNAAVSDWDEHLGRMRDFWSSVLLMSGRYKGKPIPVHAALPQIGEAHFARWLEIFRGVARDVCPADAAALFIDRAERIAESLQLGITFHRQGATRAPGCVAAPSGHGSAAFANEGDHT